MSRIRFIGDCHGKFNAYKRILKSADAENIPTIQLGDMGVGFRYKQGPRAGEVHANPPHYAMVRGAGHRFIRGNHDALSECSRHSQWIPDGHVEETSLGTMMFIGGALSIDRAYRNEGYDWWADEELSITELNALVDKYIEVRPAVMVTHECPEDVAVEVARKIGGIKMDPRFASRTRQAFQSMWSSHSPGTWLHGHWHASFDHVIKGTRFICLNELEFMDIEVGEIGADD